MNYSELKQRIEAKGSSIPILAKKINISEPGLYQMFRNKSMKIDILELIAKEIDVPIWEFFDYDPISPLEYKIRTLEQEIHWLKKNVDTMEKTIKELNKKNGELELAYKFLKSNGMLLLKGETDLETFSLILNQMETFIDRDH